LESARNDSAVRAAAHRASEFEHSAELMGRTAPLSLEIEAEKPGSEGEYTLQFLRELPGGNFLSLNRNSGRALAKSARHESMAVFRSRLREIMKSASQCAVQASRYDALCNQYNLASRNVSAAERRFSAGAITNLELRRFKVAAASAQALMVAAGTRAASALTALELNIEITFPIERTANPGWCLSNFPPLPDSIQSSMESLLESEPRIAAAAAAAEAAQLAVRAAGAAARGSRSVSAGIKYAQESNQEALVLGLSLPMGGGSIRAEALMAAQASADAALAQLNNERRAVKMELLDALSRYHSSRNLLEVFETGIIPEFSRVVTDLRAAYLAGNAGYVELLDAEGEFQEIMMSSIDAGYEANEALIDILLILGSENLDGRLGIRTARMNSGEKN
jgi:cobalt-zinc-cadmium efflux system outer membrane protein